jgi:hypothetical protein
MGIAIGAMHLADIKGSAARRTPFEKLMHEDTSLMLGFIYIIHQNFKIVKSKIKNIDYLI